MRILFLDDNPARRDWARKTLGPGNVLATVETADDAIGAMQIAAGLDGRPIDVMYLDHDLGGEVYVDPSRSDTGMAVVRWMVKNRPEVGKVIVHSLHTAAANLMVGLLLKHGFNASYVPFLRLVELPSHT